MDHKALAEYFSCAEYEFKEENICKIMCTEFEKYKSFITKLPEVSEQADKICKECYDLLDIINLYEKGLMFDAFEKVNELMNNLQDNLKSIIISEKNNDDYLNKCFYRMRNTHEKVLERKDIFHTPISMRSKVNSQRYSIPGLPCLYMSSSIYACWLEMGKPNIQNVFVSKLVLSDDAKVDILNFSMIDPKRLFYKDKRHEFHGDDKLYIERIGFDRQIDALVLWPLLFSCSLIGSRKEDFYKPEYIIPQLLLQWTRKHSNI
jgi:hypothetical protein